MRRWRRVPPWRVKSRSTKWTPIPNSAMNRSPHTNAASRMRRRAASWSVRWAMVRSPRITSSRTLVAAHDLEERLLERGAGRTHAVERDAAADEVAREARERLLVVDREPHHA